MHSSSRAKPGGSDDPLSLPVDSECRLCELGQPNSDKKLAVCQPTIWDSESQSPSVDTPLVLFVGDSPTPDDMPAGRPFTGITGSLLRARNKTSLFSQFSVRQRASVYLCNAVRCLAISDTIPASSFRACTERYLRQHMESLATLPCRNRIVVMLGAKATAFTYQLAGHRNVSSSQARQMQGTNLPICGTPWVGISTLSLNLVVAQPERLLEVFDHFHILSRYLGDNPQPALDPTFVDPSPPSLSRKD